MLTIARVAAADGAGEPEAGGAIDGEAGDEGLVEARGVGVAEGPAEAPGPLGLGLAVVWAEGLAPAGWLGTADWLAVGVGLAVGWLLAGTAVEPAGDALGVPAGAGLTSRTYRVVPAWSTLGAAAIASLPLVGERVTALAAVGRLARPFDTPAIGGQPGSSPVGQTLVTLAVTRDRSGPLVTTQLTCESTAIGVTTG